MNRDQFIILFLALVAGPSPGKGRYVSGLIACVLFLIYVWKTK